MSTIAVSAVLGAAPPAGAAVGVSVSSTLPAGATLGQDVDWSITVTNTNTPPNHTEADTLTQLRLAPSCGSAGTSTNPCPTPDAGVFTVVAATGAVGTACAGRMFTPSPPDANGAVTLTPSAPIALAPPGGVSGSDRCTVNVRLRVLKVPGIDTSPAPGFQTRANVVAELTGSRSGLAVTAAQSAEIVVGRATPTIATSASPSSVPVGGSVTDTAVVTGLPRVLLPTGTVSFQLYGPDDPTCSGAPFGQSQTSLGPSTPSSSVTTSAPFVLSQPGTYRFVVLYGGDANYLPVASVCNSANETVVARGSVTRRINDFDGNGASDISVFRPAEGSWYILTPSPTMVQWGQPGDIPVAGDYDGNGTTDVAVFRPANGAWYIRTPSPRFAVWGQPGDVPVPADYDGNGTTDIAIYRPSDGTWYVRTASPFAVQWGQPGDVPVPGDYDGNGTTDVAVFRLANSGWYIRTPSPVFAIWGQVGDVPTPGDYDGNGTTDIAVFRPGSGTWYLRTSSPHAVQWGQTGDVPAPGDYDSNGSTDVAVFRPSDNTWYVRTPTPFARTWGGVGDQPLALSSAIHRAYFGGLSAARR